MLNVTLNVIEKTRAVIDAHLFDMQSQ